jgi:hypothetical protein
MTNDLDATNYGCGSKNNWRNRMWNTVREFTSNPADAIVVYLPGAANLDAPAATRKGFKQWNMIAVERDRKVVQHLRREQRQAVMHGSLLHAMVGWPPDRPVGVIVADLVSGFDSHASDIVRAWMCMRPFAQSTLVINMQRGRESDGTNRQTVSWQHTELVRALARQWDVAPNSRALYTVFALPLFLQMHYSRCAPGGVLPDNIKAAIVTRGLTNGQFWEWRFLPPYRSGRVVMDSVVLKDCGRIEARTELMRTAENEPQHVIVARAMRRKVAAAYAVRTMRFNGTLS